MIEKPAAARTGPRATPRGTSHNGSHECFDRGTIADEAEDCAFGTARRTCDSRAHCGHAQPVGRLAHIKSRTADSDGGHPERGRPQHDNRATRRTNNDSAADRPMDMARPSRAGWWGQESGGRAGGPICDMRAVTAASAHMHIAAQSEGAALGVVRQRETMECGAILVLTHEHLQNT